MGALLLGQLLLWSQGIVAAGGPDRYVRASTDLRAVLTGALMIRDGDGARLYDLASQHAAQSRLLAPDFTLRAETTLPNSHPPFESLLLVPFIRLPYPVPFALWTLLEVAALACSVTLLATTLPLPARVQRTLILAICSYHPVHRILWLGQSTPLILLGMCGAYVAFRQRREGWLGVALALVALKPQLAPLPILLLLLHRRVRPVLVMAGIWGGLSIAAMPVLGVTWPIQYARFLASAAGWGDNLGEHPLQMYNWHALVLHLLGTAAPMAVAPVAAALSVVSGGVVLWACWHPSEQRQSTGGRLPDALTRADLLWALIGIVMVLIPLHLYLHDLTLLILPAWIIAAFATTDGVSARRWRAPLVLGYILPIVAFFASDTPGVAVVPSVVLLAATASALVWRIGNREAPETSRGERRPTTQRQVT